ncbi:hypothetical protein ABGB18_39665 [Nonomuraea sp. B12E4]|uniref:hypothetical protein n=1 Tax=Nonomuraea sp. B12E4 TaxID=3153564 RepID=UPI00325EE16D
MTFAPPAEGVVVRPVPGRWPRSGWVPAALVCAGAVGVFLWCGVSARDVAAFAAYVGGGVALPGTLLWRALAGGGRSPAEDVAAGLALGYAVEVLAYIPARAAGAPLLVLVPPVVMIGAFVAVPGLRRHWRGDGSGERMPGWCAWALAGVVGYLIVWSTVHLYRVPMTAAYVDMPYHLALVGEVKNHMPPTMPTVLGERLSYHWFVYADLAATSWVTGIEPTTLVYRLATLPMTAAMVVLVAVIGRRLAGGRWGAGVAAVGVAYFLFGPVLQEDVVFPTRSMFTAWASPTQTFGALMFAPVVLLLAGGRRPWAVLVVLLLALTGAKATFLPLLLAGLVVVLVVQAVLRGPWREWVRPAVVTFGCLLVAQFVVFGRGAYGTVIAPFAAMRELWGAVAGVGMPGLASVSVAPLLVLSLVHVFCMACVWGGVAGLGGRVLEPAMLLLLGMGLAGVGAVMVLGHPAASQLYFLEGVRPYLSVAAVCGVVAAWPSLRGRLVGGMAAVGAGGAVLGFVVEVPGGPLVRVVVPYLVLGVAAVVVWRRGHVLAVVALLAGYAMPASAWEVVGHVLPEEDRRDRLIPAGAQAAGRWLREHSAPGDVVATDLHCRFPQWRLCDSRHHWVSGFSERRVLVEGWAYAGSTQSRTELFVTSYLAVPFADPARLAANDAVFREPSVENVRHLAQKYGVKWLFTGPNPKLGKFAQLRFRNGTSTIYRIPER